MALSPLDNARRKYMSFLWINEGVKIKMADQECFFILFFAGRPIYYGNYAYFKNVNKIYLKKYLG